MLFGPAIATSALGLNGGIMGANAVHLRNLRTGRYSVSNRACARLDHRIASVRSAKKSSRRLVRAVKLPLLVLQQWLAPRTPGDPVGCHRGYQALPAILWMAGGCYVAMSLLGHWQLRCQLYARVSVDPVTSAARV